jgi:hypothetical protein
MPQFAIELLDILLCVMLLSALGLSVLGGITGRCPLILFALPQAGLLVLTVATTLVASVLHVRLDVAMALAIPLCGVLAGCSVLLNGFRPASSEIVFFAVTTVVVSAFCAWTTCASANLFGKPSVLYADGTDQLGYAQMADWMRAHVPSGKMSYAAVPRADPLYPYESFPNLMLGSEPRIGAFVFVGIVGVLERLPSSFAFDSACAIALCAAVLGVAAVFAARRWVFIFLVAGLLLSHWYDFLRSGYFGKGLAYPATLFTAGLFFIHRGDSRPLRIAPLMVAAMGSALLLSGYVTALLLLVLALTAFSLDVFYSRQVDIQEVAVIGFMAAFAVTASGFLVRPYGGGFPAAPGALLDVVSRSLEIDGWFASIPSGPISLWAFLLIAVLANVAGIVLAHREHHSVAVSLLLAPLVLLVGLVLGGFRDTVFQLTGVFYTSGLAGMGLLLSSGGAGRRRAWLFAAGILVLGLMAGTRVPRAVTAIARYTEAAFVRQHSVSLDEFDAIEHATRDQTVLVALGQEPHLAIAALVELGRRNVQLQWESDGWYTVVGGWRGWPVPRYAEPAALRLVARAAGSPRDVLMTTAHFAIVRNEAHP